MPKPTQSTKSSKDAEVKAPLQFFNHAKVKKAEDLKVALEEESLKPQTSTTKGYSIKILEDRIELVADKNVKKLPIKKIKFSKVERIIPSAETLRIYMGCRHGKTATVTSFGFTEESVYYTLMNYLAQTRGLVVDSTSIANQNSKSSTATTTSELQNNFDLDDTTLLNHENINLAGEASRKYTTSYVLWEEIESTRKHGPVENQVPSKGVAIDSKDDFEINKEDTEVNSDDQTDVITEETQKFQKVQHCPCCLQNLGINLEIKGHGDRAYAPSSIDCRTCSNFPTHFSQNYKRLHPSQPPHRQDQTLNEGISSVNDEPTLGKYENPEPVERYSPNKPRQVSQPQASTKHDGKAGFPVLPRPPQLPQKIKPSAQMKPQRSWTAKSSSSSGYTSDSTHEDSLELKVNSSFSGKYVRDKKRTVTGRVKGTVSHGNKEPQKFYYRKPNSGLPRFPQLKIQ
ncbi:unnamed protein product [Rodentolepis nana]|uniref:DUF5734 domain-containing protein n=1 Tax=Rodentolepis nana TaxID=102285 RepID=A0A0R3TZY5_RODNA|nr:unnamed protein product [Rodentolepis nana]